MFSSLGSECKSLEKNREQKNMSEEARQPALRPFFIAAIEQGDGEGRPCVVNSENVTFMRPVYEGTTPTAHKTMLLTNTGRTRASHLIVMAPYPVVRDIFAQHGYHFVDEGMLRERTASFAKSANGPKP